jgi:hypothetical protein
VELRVKAIMGELVTESLQAAVVAVQMRLVELLIIAFLVLAIPKLLLVTAAEVKYLLERLMLGVVADKFAVL